MDTHLAEGQVTKAAQAFDSNQAISKQAGIWRSSRMGGHRSQHPVQQDDHDGAASHQDYSKCCQSNDGGSIATRQEESVAGADSLGITRLDLNN